MSCLTWGFPYDCPAKMPGEGALNATPFTYPSKGAALPVGARQRGDQIAARVPLEHVPAERRVYPDDTQARTARCS